jgi:hypothetical protein
MNAMKKIGLLLVVAMALASPVVAGQIQVGYPASSYGIYQSGLGGEFTLNPLTGWLSLAAYGSSTQNVGVSGTFQTFCIEGNETISGYSATYNAALSQNAMYGSQPTTGDPISVGTGWLYSQFAQGTLAGYNFGGTTAQRQASAGLLQNAIWWLEGEEGITYNSANPFMFAVVQQFQTPAAAMADGGWNYGVYALNLWAVGGTLETSRVQDQLFYQVPDGGTTLMLLGGALVGIGALRRKFRL